MREWNSLKKSEDFLKVYRQGRSYGNKLLVLYVLENGESETGRLGVSVSKKVGNSVVRHRLRRLIKESFRLHESEWAKADVVVVARREAVGKSYAEIEQALLHVGKKTRIWLKGEMV
ncbi:MAG: ribonuclease P protein component [Lachnospiraceae bacterium]|nr:ribonuclease P protein component [Lachnospiraceae bacterium]